MASRGSGTTATAIRPRLAGLNGLNEGQKLSYEVVNDPRRGKSSAEKLKAL
jgi:cold shock CspA family protein